MAFVHCGTKHSAATRHHLVKGTITGMAGGWHRQAGTALSPDCAGARTMRVHRCRADDLRAFTAARRVANIPVPQPMSAAFTCAREARGAERTSAHSTSPIQRPRGVSYHVVLLGRHRACSCCQRARQRLHSGAARPHGVDAGMMSRPADADVARFANARRFPTPGNRHTGYWAVSCSVYCVELQVQHSDREAL